MKRSLPAIAVCFFFAVVAFVAVPLRAATHLMENLGRGVVAVRTSATDTYVSWRVLGTDPVGASYNLYRSTGGGPAVALNASPITGGTNLVDAGADLAQANAYYVRAVVSGVEQAASAAFTVPANAPIQQYLRVPLQQPAPGAGYTYSPNDTSVGDVDGDGEYELIVKWDPSNAQDNANDGVTGNVFIDAYRLDGTFLWRIDLGRNIRAGAHYTQFLVYDFDGDGKAELVCKTAPNTRDGTGTFIGQPGKFLGTPSAPIDHNADYRNSAGYIRLGPEFFTIFNGETGAEMVTTNYVVPRNTNPASNDVTAWGDDYGNRVDRFLACVAYLDGQRPSIVLCRGYYTRAVLAAFDWRNGQLTQRWTFDTGNTGTTSPVAAWRGQGAHSLTVGDVDGDGRDDITYGAAAIASDGTGLYSTALGHGDALHMSDMDPNRPGLEVWMAHEDPGSYGPNGMDFRDARTGALIFGVSGQGADIGRAVAGDIDPRFLGYEMWGTRGGLMNAQVGQISPSHPNQINFMSWWDGDLLREILDGTTISKWDWNANNSPAIFQPSGVASNNGTKSNPSLSADILGDWREELVVRESGNTALRIYTTVIPTTHRITTLMHDRQYRLAIAWQNVAYNQPPHPSFYLGEGMATPPPPDIVTSLGGLPTPAPAVNSSNRQDPVTSGTGATTVVFRVTFNTVVTGVDAADFTVTTTGSVTGTVTVTGVASVGGGYAYNVTVSSITGTGTIRLDLKPTGTGITGPGGAPISGGFTGGQIYNRATLAWINQASGGLWSNAANWDGGVIADGVGAVPIFGNFDLTISNAVVLDTPRTISGLTFGDTAPGSAASWTVTDNGDPANVLTLDTISGSPTNTVNTLGTGATATLDVTVASTDGFTKAGTGTLVLTRPEAITGSLTISGGTLRLDTGSALALGGTNTVNLNTTNNATLQANGGSFVAGGLVTLGGGATVAGILRIDAGSVTLNGGVRTNNDGGSTVRVNGGTFNATDVNIRRNSAANIDFNSGFIVAGGTANVGTIFLGNNNSNGAMSVEGGVLTATGAVTIGNNSGSTRGGGMRVTGGQFTSTNVANGIILTNTAGNVTTAAFSGGVSTVEKVTFGAAAAVNTGSGTLTLNGGTLYLGSGGLVRNGSGSYTAAVTLTSGILAAKAGWSTSLPIVLTGGVQVKAADAADTPFNITLGGAVSGGGGLAKSGAGMLTLAAANTFAGLVDVNAGTLHVSGSLSGAAALNVNAGGLLVGAGTVDRAVTLNAGGAVAPGVPSSIGVLSAASLTWNGGGTLALDLHGNGVSDGVALTGALTRGTAGTHELLLNPTTPLVPGNTYTVATFSSTNFTAADFTVTGLPAGYAGGVAVGGTSLQLTIVATPSITSASTAAATYGAPFTHAITAVNSPTSFSATGLPPGLVLDPVSGVISGTPAATGTFNITLGATNLAGTGNAPLALTVGKAAAGIALGNLAATYNGSPHTASATTSPPNLAVNLTYDGSATAPTNAGSYDVVATIADANYFGSTTGTLVIDKAPQAITFPNPGDKTYGDPDFALGATSNSGLTVSYTIVSGPATVSGNTVTLTGAGTVVVRASQPGNGNYLAAAEVEVTFAVAKSGDAEITLAGLHQAYDGTPKSVTATTDPADLTVNITYDGNAAAPTLPGSYAVVATIDDPDYSGSATGTLVISITAIVRHAPTLNADIDGSVQVLLPESSTLNGGAMISGDLLVPGLPSVQLNGNPVYGGTVDGTGGATPTNHKITLNGNSVLRHVVRRTDAIPMPTVAAPPQPTGTRNVSLNSTSDSPGDFATLRNLTLNGNAGSRAIPPGTYGSFTANGNGGFILGVVGATEPSVYNLQGLTLNGTAQLQVVGPVILTLASSINANGNVGSSEHPEWLTLRVANGGVTLNGNVALRGRVVAPNGTVTINGSSTLTGSVAADRLTLNGNALLKEAP